MKGIRLPNRWVLRSEKIAIKGSVMASVMRPAAAMSTMALSTKRNVASVTNCGRLADADGK